MTKSQYLQWKDFARRMCRHGLTTAKGKRLPKASRAKVSERIEWFFDVTIPDNSNDSRDDEGMELVSRIRSWDDTNNDKLPKDQYGRTPIGPYVCDMVDDLLGEGFNPYYWGDGNRAYEQFDELWGGRVRCCLRAGLDLACEPSAGVAGFTVGDLRRMYPKGIPKWINKGFKKGSISDSDGEPIDLNAEPNEAGVWL